MKKELFDFLNGHQSLKKKKSIEKGLEVDPVLRRELEDCQNIQRVLKDAYSEIDDVSSGDLFELKQGVKWQIEHRSRGILWKWCLGLALAVALTAIGVIWELKQEPPTSTTALMVSDPNSNIQIQVLDHPIQLNRSQP